VKLGGSTLGSHDTSLRDIAESQGMWTHFIVVHGGGAKINEWLSRMQIEPKFIRGLRVTDEATLEVVVAVLAGLVNKQIVAQLGAYGADARGISGPDEGCLQAEQYDPELGFVGRVTSVNDAFLSFLCGAPYGGTVPVVAPIGFDPSSGQLLNVNADTAAGEIAHAISAQRLIFLTDVAGVLDADGRLIERLTASEARTLIADGIAGGGMIPKLEAAIRAASAGCATRIIDGTQEGALRRAIAGEPIGTTITGSP
jgi:acetylglutamate kinase